MRQQKLTKYWVREINVCNGRYAEVEAESASAAVRTMTDWPIDEIGHGWAAAADPNSTARDRAYVKAEPLEWMRR